MPTRAVLLAIFSVSCAAMVLSVAVPVVIVPNSFDDSLFDGHAIISHAIQSPKAAIECPYDIQTGAHGTGLPSRPGFFIASPIWCRRLPRGGTSSRSCRRTSCYIQKTHHVE